MQTFQDIPSTLKVKDSRARLLERDEALRSGFAGTSAPSSPTMVAGQRFFNTTLSEDGVYDGTAVRELLQTRHGCRVVDTLADLKALRPGVYPAVFMHGRGASGDGAHGVWRWVSGSTATPDDALVVQANAGGSGRWMRDVEFLFSPLWWGVKTDLSADALAGVRAAVVAAIGAGRGGGVILPPGFIAMSDTLVIDGPCEIIGAGMGVDSGAGYSGGTVLRFGHASNDNIQIASRGGVHLRDFAMDSSVTRTGGAAIDVQGDGTTPRNRGSVFERLRIGGPWNGLRVRSGVDWTFRDFRIIDHRSHGVYLSGEGFSGSNGDEEVGHSYITNGLIGDYNIGTSTACVRYNRGGNVTVQAVKLLRSNYGVMLAKTAGATGTLIINACSIEQQFISPIHAEQTTSGGEFSNLSILANQLSVIEGSEIPGADPGCTVNVATGTPTTATCWIRNIVIKGNIVNHVITPSAARACFNILDGEGVEIEGNVVHYNGSADANNYGFNVGAAARNVRIGPNTFLGLTAVAKRYQALTTHCRVTDTTPIPLANLPTCADGSIMYASDGLKGSSPLSASSTGVPAFRVNGAWETIGGGGLSASGGTMTGTLELAPGGNDAIRIKDGSGTLRSYMAHAGLIGGLSTYALRIRCEGHDIGFGISGTLSAYFAGSGGHLIPGSDGGFDFGASGARWRNLYTNKANFKSYTVASAPSGAAGEVTYFSNARKNGEGSGAGTGCLAFYDTAWKAVDTGAAIAA